MSGAILTTLKAIGSPAVSSWADGEIHEARSRSDLEIFDRVGGDGFVSGPAYAKLAWR